MRALEQGLRRPRPGLRRRDHPGSWSPAGAAGRSRRIRPAGYGYQASSPSSSHRSGWCGTIRSGPGGTRGASTRPAGARGRSPPSRRSDGLHLRWAGRFSGHRPCAVDPSRWSRRDPPSARNFGSWADRHAHTRGKLCVSGWATLEPAPSRNFRSHSRARSRLFCWTRPEFDERRGRGPVRGNSSWRWTGRSWEKKPTETHPPKRIPRPTRPLSHVGHPKKGLPQTAQPASGDRGPLTLEPDNRSRGVYGSAELSKKTPVQGVSMGENERRAGNGHTRRLDRPSPGGR